VLSISLNFFFFQDFLNSTCEEILHLNDQKLDTYKGNYDTFKQLEEKKREQATKAWELEQKRIKQLKASGSTKAKANEQIKQQKTKDQAGSKKKKSDAIASGVEGAEVKVSLAALASSSSFLKTCLYFMFLSFLRI